MRKYIELYGPNGTGYSERLLYMDGVAHCRELAESHYENFSVICRLLPRELINPMYVIYGFCRWADDLADESNSPQEATELLNWWDEELSRCYRRESRHPVFVALEKVANDFMLPKTHFCDLIVAFRRDQIQNRYETFNDLLDYCRYSANPVGRIVLQLFNNFSLGAPQKKQWQLSPEMFASSDSICTGLQLINFWQDIARDWEKERIYIPLDVASYHGFRLPEKHEKFIVNPSFLSMLQFLVDDAKSRLHSGTALINSVPSEYRIPLSLFQQGGLSVAKMIEKQKYDVIKKRPALSKWQKGLIFLKCILRRFTRNN